MLYNVKGTIEHSTTSLIICEIQLNKTKAIMILRMLESITTNLIVLIVILIAVLRVAAPVCRLLGGGRRRTGVTPLTFTSALLTLTHQSLQLLLTGRKTL